MPDRIIIKDDAHLGIVVSIFSGFNSNWGLIPALFIIFVIKEQNLPYDFYLILPVETMSFVVIIVRIERCSGKGVSSFVFCVLG